jgi:hypothetical protein
MNSPKSSYFNNYRLKNLLLLTGGGISLITLVILLGIWRTSTNFLNGITAIFNPVITSAEADLSHLIVKQIQGVSELTTTIFVMDAVVPTSSERKIGEWVIGETNLLYIARGEVRAGIDLSEVQENDITVTDNTIQIELPSPKILDHKIDVQHSQVYDYDRGFLNLGPDVAPELQIAAQRQTLAKVLETACNQGILTQAQERAVTTVTQLLTTAGYENIEVKTTVGNGCG